MDSLLPLLAGSTLAGILSFFALSGGAAFLTGGVVAGGLSVLVIGQFIMQALLKIAFVALSILFVYAVLRLVMGGLTNTAFWYLSDVFSASDAVGNSIRAQFLQWFLYFWYLLKPEAFISVFLSAAAGAFVSRRFIISFN